MYHEAKLTPANSFVASSASERTHLPTHTFQTSELAGSNDASAAMGVESINIGGHNFIKSLTQLRHIDWDVCETIRLQELNEARQRASQMENTMRWWTQCTVIWRQKWQTVRHERNRVRDELARTRVKLKEAKEEIQRLNDENAGREAQAKALTKKVEQVKLLCPHDSDAANSIWDRLVTVLTTAKNADPVINSVRNDVTTQTEPWKQNLVNDLINVENVHQPHMQAMSSLESTDCYELDTQVDGTALNTPELSPPTSSGGHSSYSSAKSIFAKLSTTLTKPAEFTTTGETPPHTPMYHYGGGGGRTRRRNSLC